MRDITNENRTTSPQRNESIMLELHKQGCFFINKTELCLVLKNSYSGYSTGIKPKGNTLACKIVVEKKKKENSLPGMNAKILLYFSSKDQKCINNVAGNFIIKSTENILSEICCISVIFSFNVRKLI